jgi:NADPH-dependent glutamate synthase beta subunit-like oxidoreductase
VLIDGEPWRAPWIDMTDLKARGAVVLWTDGDRSKVPTQFAAVAGAARVQAPFTPPYRRGSGSVSIGWAILQPQPPPCENRVNLIGGVSGAFIGGRTAKGHSSAALRQMPGPCRPARCCKIPTCISPLRRRRFSCIAAGRSIAALRRRGAGLKPTDITHPDYFHKVVDCQWACPAHTPVPEYIRLIAAGRYGAAYLVNWKSNVFPGILGRTCDRPCEPACRRGRVEAGSPEHRRNAAKPEPVAICRLKRVAADYKEDIRSRLPQRAPAPNGKRVALVGGGPASLTVARDLAPLGYECVVFDGDPQAGGMMRTQIPKFRLPDRVIDEEVGYILDMGIEFRGDVRVDSLAGLLADDAAERFDAVFIGSGAPRGRDLDIPGRRDAAANIHIGIEWLSSVSFGHTTAIGRRVVVLGGGNTAMDCCRSSRRLGGEDVQVVVRSGFDEMKASPWEKEDAMHEGIPIHNFLVPLEFTHDGGRLTGVMFQKVTPQQDARGRRQLVPAGEPPVHFPCDDVLVAVGQENAFPWIERDLGITFDESGMPIVDRTTMASTRPGVYFGGDSAFGPKNIIWAVAHGHDAAISIDLHCRGELLSRRPAAHLNLVSQKMGIHEWSYDNAIHADHRYRVPLKDTVIALKDIRTEVELGFDPKLAYAEAQRCLNCDVETVFADKLCIECDACVDICPMDCITFTGNGDEGDLRERLSASATNLTQDLYVSPALRTGRVMAKDEDVCLHCGLCAERCPTAAWDMQKFELEIAYAGSMACTR